MAKVRMKDIAEKIGVSTVTVSKALSGQRGMSEEMRAKIIKTAAEMGYLPGKRDRSRIPYKILILTSERFVDRQDSFYSHLLQLIIDEATAMECFTVTEVITTEMEQKCIPPVSLQKKDYVDGVIVLGFLEDHYLGCLQDDSVVPSVFLDFTTHSKLCDCVISDSFYGSCQLTDYLFRKGHRKIAFVGTVLSTGSITERYLGYLKSMMEHHVEVPKEWVIPDRDIESGLVDLEKFFTLPDDMPTAFVCNSDLTAAHLSRKLAALGFRCPEDVSITGFDNFVYPGIIEGQFTTYEVDTKAMARKAVHNLVHKLNGEYYRRGIIVVTGRLVEYGSVRSPKDSMDISERRERISAKTKQRKCLPNG